MRSIGTRAAVVLALGGLLGLLPACEDGPEDPIETPPAARSFLFGMRGVPDEDGQFVATTTRPDVLAALEAELALPAARRARHIQGPIERGDGGHNLPWHWHFAPESWQIVEISIELCDGTPRLVEEDLDYWVDVVGQFCPWGSYVQREL